MQLHRHETYVRTLHEVKEIGAQVTLGVKQNFTLEQEMMINDAKEALGDGPNQAEKRGLGDALKKLQHGGAYVRTLQEVKAQHEPKGADLG